MNPSIWCASTVADDGHVRGATMRIVELVAAGQDTSDALAELGDALFKFSRSWGGGRDVATSPEDALAVLAALGTPPQPGRRGPKAAL